MLNSIESETGKEETPFAFSRPILKEVKSRNENVPLHDDVCEKLDATFAKELDVAPEKISVPDAGDCDEPQMLFEIETEARTEFLNRHIKDKIMARWELMGEKGPADDFTDEMPAQDLSEALRETMPLMLGFQATTEYIELEYMVITDRQSGKSVAPVVTVEPSEDGKAGNIYLNDKLVACVAGAQDVQASDVKLVQAKA